MIESTSASTVSAMIYYYFLKGKKKRKEERKKFNALVYLTAFWGGLNSEYCHQYKKRGKRATKRKQDA